MSLAVEQTVHRRNIEAGNFSVENHHPFFEQVPQSLLVPGTTLALSRLRIVRRKRNLRHRADFPE